MSNYWILTWKKCYNINRYGLPFVSPNNILVSTINGTGAAIEFIYVVIYIIYAPKKEKAKISGLLMFVLTVFSAVALVSLFALHGKSRKLFCGFAATIFSIIMYASPLSIMVSYFSCFLVNQAYICIYIYGFWGMNLIAIWVPN